MGIDERVHFLKTVSVFEETPDELLRMIAENLTEMDAVAGEDIVLKGSIGDSMYFSRTGVVDVHDGDHVFTQLGAGDSLENITSSIKRSGRQPLQRPNPATCFHSGMISSTS